MDEENNNRKKEYWSITKSVACFFGLDNQLIVAIEEMSELQKEFCKYKRNNGDIERIAEEIADVLNVLDSIVLLLQCGESIKKWRYKKIERTKRRLEEKEAKI